MRCYMNALVRYINDFKTINIITQEIQTFRNINLMDLNKSLIVLHERWEMNATAA